MTANRWVLQIKTKGGGSVDRFKARLVAKSFSEKRSIDNDETFSLVAQYDTVRIM